MDNSGCLCAYCIGTERIGCKLRAAVMAVITRPHQRMGESIYPVDREESLGCLYLEQDGEFNRVFSHFKHIQGGGEGIGCWTPDARDIVQLDCFTCYGDCVWDT